MRKLFTLLMVSAALSSNAQTQVYATGQTYSDDWTGWSAVLTSGVSSDNYSANTWTFSVSGTYDIEITRQFSINSQDLDIYWSCTAQNATAEVLHSTDGSTWSSVQTLSYGGTFGLSTMVIPTFNPTQESFYLKLKMSGTPTAGPMSCIYNNMYINADLNNPFGGGGASVEEYELAANVIYSGGFLQVITALQGYTVNIYNISGQMIKSDVNLKTFDLSSYNAGVYLVNVLAEDGKSKTFKISHL